MIVPRAGFHIKDHPNSAEPKGDRAHQAREHTNGRGEEVWAFSVLSDESNLQEALAGCLPAEDGEEQEIKGCQEQHGDGTAQWSQQVSSEDLQQGIETVAVGQGTDTKRRIDQRSEWQGGGAKQGKVDAKGEPAAPARGHAHGGQSLTTGMASLRVVGQLSQFRVAGGAGRGPRGGPQEGHVKSLSRAGVLTRLWEELCEGREDRSFGPQDPRRDPERICIVRAQESDFRRVEASLWSDGQS